MDESNITVGHIYRDRETHLLVCIKRVGLETVELESVDPAADADASRDYVGGVSFETLKEDFQHIPGMVWRGEVSKGDTITLISRHGMYQCQPMAQDIMMDRYLPASIKKLTEEIVELHGYPLETPVTSVMEGLMMLAELNGYATN